MQYLKNLQSHLTQSLWIRDHIEPNKQRDFINCTRTTTRFSTSSISTSAHHPRHNESISTTPTKGKIEASESKRRISIDDIFTHHPDTGSCTNSTNNIKSHSVPNNNNNNDNRVHSSVSSYLNILSSLRHNLFHPSRSSRERATVSQEVQPEPVILSLTPLSKSTRKKYLKKKQPGITSLLHSSTTPPNLPPFPQKVQLKKEDNGEKQEDYYEGESSSEDECLRDKTSSNLGRIVLSPSFSLKGKESLLLAVADDPLLHLLDEHRVVSETTPEEGRFANGNKIDDIFVTSGPSQSFQSSSLSTSSLSTVTSPLEEEKKSGGIVKSELQIGAHHQPPPSSSFLESDNNNRRSNPRTSTRPKSSSCIYSSYSIGGGSLCDQPNSTNDRKKGHFHCREYRKVSVDCGEFGYSPSIQDAAAKDERQKALHYYIHENFTFPDSTYSKVNSEQSQSNKVGREEEKSAFAYNKPNCLAEHYSPLNKDAVPSEIGLEAAGTRGDQSSLHCSSRSPTFTRDRPCSSSGGSSIFSISSDSCNSTTNSSTSSVEPNSVIVTGALNNCSSSLSTSACAPVVVFPSIGLSPSTAESSSSSSSSSPSQIILPLPAGVEGLSCSHKVNQRKKSIHVGGNNNSVSTNVNSEICRSVARQGKHSFIQSLLCTKGFHLLCTPKKLLSAIFQRRTAKNKERKRLKATARSSSSNDQSSTLNKNHHHHRKNSKNKRRNLKFNSSITKRNNEGSEKTKALTKAELRLWATMDHEDLIRELPTIEKLSNQERLRLAHKRRMIQLKKFQQYEKELNSNSKKHRADSDLVRRNLPGKHQQNHHHPHGGRKGSRRIRFRNSIMLLEAAGRNDVEEVRLLLESGVNPDVANEDGLTALHQCCIDDNEEMMKILLDYGANVNAEDSEKWTPLHAAATCGHLHLVQYLIAKGANLLAVNAEGNMPYDICDDETTLDYIESEMAKRGVTQELIEEIRALPETKMLQDVQRIHAQGGDLEVRDADGATPLHIASANGYYRAAEFLLDNHVATDVQDKDFWQPIHAAACWGHLDVLELLVQNGADLDARTKNNETPYAICEDPEIKERIIQLRTEQQTKRANEGRKRPSRTHSTNSRTQSIRRTSQRDKGLTSKRDAADEAQMLRAREELHKENSLSPTSDMSQAVNGSGGGSTNKSASSVAVNGNGAMNGSAGHNTHNGNTSSEDDHEENKSLPPSLMGRDSVGKMKMKSDEMNRLQEIAVKSGATNHNNHHQLNNQISPTNNANAIKMNNLRYNENGSLQKNQNNIQKNLNSSGASGNSPVSVLSSPIPDDNGNLLPKPEINPSVDNKVPLGGMNDSMKQYHHPPASPTMSLRRFVGDPSETVGDYDGDGGKRCCVIV